LQKLSNYLKKITLGDRVFFKKFKKEAIAFLIGIDKA